MTEKLKARIEETQPTHFIEVWDNARIAWVGYEQKVEPPLPISKLEKTINFTADSIHLKTSFIWLIKRKDRSNS